MSISNVLLYCNLDNQVYWWPFGWFLLFFFFLAYNAWCHGCIFFSWFRSLEYIPKNSWQIDCFLESCQPWIDEPISPLQARHWILSSVFVTVWFWAGTTSEALAGPGGTGGGKEATQTLYPGKQQQHPAENWELFSPRGLKSPCVPADPISKRFL